MWPDRIDSDIRRASGHVVIHAPPEYGGHVVLGRLQLASYPTVRLVLPPGDESGVLHGNVLSDALEDAFGFRLFGYGLPFQFGLSILQAQAPLLGRFVLAVTGTEKCGRAALEAVLALDSSSCKVVVSYHDAQLDGPHHRIGSRVLALTQSEAEALARSVLSENEIRKAWKQARGAYLAFLSLVSKAGSLPPVQPVSRPSDVPAHAAEHILSAFIRQGRWIEALELAFEHDEERALELFRQSGRIILDQGLHERLWTLLTRFPQHVFADDDELMYLYFVTAMGANRHRSVAGFVRNYLQDHDAPDLRARWAVAIPASNSLSDATRAYRDRPNVNTSRALGFVLTMANRIDEAVEVLREAIEMAEATEDVRGTCAVALDTSHALTLGVQYASAKRWAHWGLQRYTRHRVGDELLRTSLVAHLAYLQLITDEPDAAEAQLASVKLPDELAGVPMMESLVSTRGDLALHRGDLEAAHDRYRQQYERLALANIGFGALDLVRVLVRASKVDEARRIINEASDLAGDGEASTASRWALAVARGHVHYAANRLSQAEEAYASVIAKAGETTPLLAAQAVIGLALTYSADENFRRAVAMLAEHSRYWRELGLSGWCLLSVNPSRAESLYAAVTGGSPAVDALKLLGERTVIQSGLATPLSLRHAEVAALLALNPDGFRTEELLLELYGDDGKLGSLKALVSRVRRIVPIRARPYRLEGGIGADVVKLEEYLSAGKIREALELYKGPLLPESEAPGIRRARDRIDEALRQAVLHAGDADMALRLARKFNDDLELWERARELTEKDDPAYPLIRAQIRRIRGEWGL